MATLNLSNLTKYTDQMSGILLKESILVDNTFDYVSIQSGIKYADSINLLTSTLIGVAGTCGPISATGTNTLSQREIVVCPIKFEDNPVCLVQFEEYWMGQLAKEGSYNESAPQAFNELYLADKIGKIGDTVASIFWRGSTDGNFSATGNNLLCNGILETLLYTSATNSIVSSTYSGALTTATALDVIDNMISLIPTDILAAEDLTIFMSHANFRILKSALVKANFYPMFDGVTGSAWVIENYLNTNVRIVATKGLNGLNQMVLTPSSNLFLGTDSFGELKNGDNIQFWYDQHDDQVYFRSKLKIGAQVAFPQYCVVKAS